MLSKLAIFFVLLAPACIPCSSEVSRSVTVQHELYGAQIDACITKKACAPLCREVFELDIATPILHCGVTGVGGTAATINVRYDDPGTCADDYDEGDIYLDDSGGDDGSYDDGSSDDGSGSDDGSTDTGSDTGTDDGSTTDDGSGSDTGTGTDDGGGDPAPRTAPRAPHVASPALPTIST